MPNPFSKGWKYMMSSFDKKIEDNADPKVQIAQAAEAERERHRQIQQQAAAVIGNRNQLEMQLGRMRKEHEKLTNNTRQALSQADAARAAGDEAKAQKMEQTAEVFASQLVSIETELEHTTGLHQQAVVAAKEAQQQAEQSQLRYEEMKNQIRELEAQADQAKMQETSSQTLQSMQGVSSKANVPTLDDIRDKIESRYAKALGAQELAQQSAQSRMAEIEASGVDARADMRLAELRAQMQSENNQITAGKGTSTTPALDRAAAADVTDVEVDGEVADAAEQPEDRHFTGGADGAKGAADDA